MKTLEAQVGQFLLGCKCPVSRGIVVQEQDPLGDLPAAFFLQNVLQLHQQRWVILRVDSLAFWKIINEEDAFLISKNRGEKSSSGFLHLDFFWGVGVWDAMSPLHWLLLCLRVIVIKPGFVQGHQSRQEIIWIATKIFQMLLSLRRAPLTLLIRFQAFRDPLRGELPHVQIFMYDGPNPLTWDAQVLSYWFSRNPAFLQDKLVDLMNNFRGGHCFGSTRTRRITGGKITTFKLDHPVFDGGIRWYIFP